MLLFVMPLGTELVSGGPKSWYFNTKGSVVHTASTVKSSEEICVPWASRLLARIVSLACSGLLRVDEVVGVVARHLADDEGAFPRCRELVLAGYSLDQPEHKVSLLEGSWLDLLVVVSAQVLLVDGGPAECQQPALF